MASFSNGASKSLSKAAGVNQPRPQSQLQPQNLHKKDIANPSQPKRARATTTATTKKDATPEPPSKKSRVSSKREPAKPAAKAPAAKTPAVKTSAAKTDTTKPAPKPAKSTTAPPVKKGAAAAAGKKGVAVKKPVPRKRNPNPGYVLVTDDSVSD
jgi:hypothetical protein